MPGIPFAATCMWQTEDNGRVACKIKTTVSEQHEKGSEGKWLILGMRLIRNAERFRPCGTSKFTKQHQKRRLTGFHFCVSLG